MSAASAVLPDVPDIVPDGLPDTDTCYRAVVSRDPRFDGWIYVGVLSTGIYCRPSCPAVTPKPANVRFYAAAAAAHTAGFRACRRCRPDSVPGSPEWDVRADVVGRAMRLIADGVAEREGISGLARRLGYSERHLHRQLVAEIGAGPLALARAQRAHAARILIETTTMPLADVAFAAGFASVRQFNDTVRQVFASTPSGLRTTRAQTSPADGARGAITLRLPYRAPYAGAATVEFLATRAVAGVEEVTGAPDRPTYRRTLRLPHGHGVAELTPDDGFVRCTLRLADLRDLNPAVQRCRRLLDLDADPVAVDAALGADDVLGPLVRRAGGRRVPGASDATEIASRAVLGQQISVAGARRLAGRVVGRYGTELGTPDGALTHVFPSPQALADADPADLPMPGSRKRTLLTLSAAIANGDVDLEPGAARASTRDALLVLPGVGPWTADYLAMRALGDPDVALPTDLGVRRAVAALGHPDSPAAVTELAERWRPWRSYATAYLWSAPTRATSTDERNET